MSDAGGTIQVLAEARSGSQAGMGRLAVLVWERLYPFVLRTTLDRDATEDIIQETLLAMLRRLGELRHDERFWPWIHRIAWSKIRNRLRDRRRRSSLAAVLLDGRESETDWARGSESILDAQIHQETLQQIGAAIAQLNRRQRDIMQLRCYDQLAYTEIASRMSTTPERARANFHRAKQSLRKHLTCGV